MHCEGRGMLRDRVLAIRHGNVFDPHSYRHVLSQPRFAPLAASTAGQSGTELASARRVLTSFNVTRVMKTGEMTLFAVGTYDDQFVESDGRLLIRHRTVVLDSRNLDTLLVIPL
jgi:3-phenylpropionate/cinnamic acid dioxygenase small subunit